MRGLVPSSRSILFLIYGLILCTGWKAYELEVVVLDFQVHALGTGIVVINIQSVEVFEFVSRFLLLFLTAHQSIKKLNPAFFHLLGRLQLLTNALKRIRIAALFGSSLPSCYSVCMSLYRITKILLLVVGSVEVRNVRERRVC